SERRIEETVRVEVGECGHQLATGQIGGCTHDDHRARSCTAQRPLRLPTLPQLVARGEDVAHRAHPSFLTAWPPNSWRNAAITFAPNDSSCLERRRASSES